MGLLQHFNWASVITCHITACMLNHSQMVGENQCSLQNCQVGLLQHVVGNPLCVVKDPLQVAKDPLHGEPIKCMQCVIFLILSITQKILRNCSSILKKRLKFHMNILFPGVGLLVLSCFPRFYKYATAYTEFHVSPPHFLIYRALE